MSLMATRQQAGASTSCSSTHAQHARMAFGPVPYRSRLNRTLDVSLRASEGSSGSSDSFAEAQSAASRAFKKAQGKWSAFAKEQKLEQRANEAFKQAGDSVRDAADKAKDKARRVFVQLDSEYELTSKTARAARRAEELARDIDQTYGIRRRARSAADYITRSWPTWQRQLNEFSSTWYGKVAVFAALCVLLSSPLFWGLLNVLLLLWWLSVPVAMLLLNYAREQQAQRLAQEQAEAEAARRRAANPFSDIFGNAQASWSARAAGNNGSSSRRGASTGTRNSWSNQQDGPVVEAEWTTIDEGDSPANNRGTGSSRKR